MADPREVGIATIDDEHRKLVSLFDAFARCIKEGAPVEDAYDIVREAIAVANAHFEHEERLIAETRYPNAEDHKFRHRHLRMQLTTLVGHTVGIAVHDHVTEERLFEMRRLLEEHIEGPDRDLADHLMKANAA